LQGLKDEGTVSFVLTRKEQEAKARGWFIRFIAFPLLPLQAQEPSPCFVVPLGGKALQALAGG